MTWKVQQSNLSNMLVVFIKGSECSLEHFFFLRHISNPRLKTILSRQRLASLELLWFCSSVCVYNFLGCVSDLTWDIGPLAGKRNFETSMEYPSSTSTLGPMNVAEGNQSDSIG